jgi:tetratricopeptide (TPR) repeat protein
MNPENVHPTRKSAPYFLGTALFLLPLVYHPGLGSSDMLPKRMILYITGFGLSMLGVWYASAQPNLRKRSPLFVPASAYILVNVMSVTWSTNPFSGWVEVTQLLVLLILLFVVTQLLEPGGYTVCARLNTLGALILSLIGIAQYIGIPLDIPSVGLPSGTFVFRNLAASYLVGAIPIGIYVLLTDPDDRRKFLWGLSLTSMALFLVFTRTRGAWLGMALGILVAGLLLVVSRSGIRLLTNWTKTNVRGRTFGLCLCLVVFCAGLLLPNRSSREVIQRFDEQKPSAVAAAASIVQEGSDRGRFTMWQHTIRMFLDHPIRGVGLDNWEFIYPLYDKGDPGGKITSASEPVRPHNDYLWIASELGILGSLAFLWLLITAGKSIGAAVQSNDQNRSILAVCSAMGLVALLGHGVFSFPKEQPASATLFWVHLSALSVLSSVLVKSRSRMWARLLPAVAISGLAVVLNWRHIQFDIFYHRALAYGAVEQWLPAGRLMELALDQGVFDHRAAFLRGRYLQHGRNTKAAIEAYEKALEFHPNYAHTHHNLGILHAGAGAWNRAVESYRTTLSIRPGYTQARVHLGNLYIRQGQFEEAIREYSVVVVAWPDNPQPWATLGTLFLQQGKHQTAVAHLRRAALLDPKLADVFNNLGLALEQSGEYRQAVNAYGRALELWSGSQEERENLTRHITELAGRAASSGN